MGKIMVFVAVAVMGFFSVAGGAYALVFDFTGATGSAASWAYEEAGVSLLATGWVNGVSGGVVVHRDANGLGVAYPKDDAYNGAASQIDGKGPAETLILTFDRVVLLQRIAFSRVGNNDGYALKIDGEYIFQGDIPGGNSDLSDNGFSAMDFSGTKGRTFEFLSPELNDDFKIKGFSADKVTTPEPATVALMGMGLVGLARRKNKRVHE